MSTTEQAYQTTFVQTFVEQLEAGGVSKLRETVFTEAVLNGNQATFLVAGSDGDEAVTRGVNGELPYYGQTSEQYTATLKPWYAPKEVADFNIFASQGSKDAMMQKSVIKMMNRRVDRDIIGALDTTSRLVQATAITANIKDIQKARGILGNSNVDLEDVDNIFGLVTPSFMSYLEQTKEFSNAEYVEVKPYAGGSETVAGTKFLRWCRINWITSTLLTGLGTSAEYCYLYHRNGIGHAMNGGADGTGTVVGYDQKHHVSYVNSKGFMGSKVLEAGNIIRFIHDGHEIVAA